MGSSQQFSLRWNNYLSHITEAFDTLRSDEDLVDVTLSCEGKRIRAHKMLLSACSTYFRDLFKENPCQHPVIIFRNVKFDDLVALIDFIYQGEVNVVQEQLSSFLTTAELLAVQGLSEGTGKDTNADELDQPDSTTLPSEPDVKMFNRAPHIIQQLPGTSNGAGASVSLYPVEKHSESTPTLKRRKLSSNISVSQPYPLNRKKEETENREDQETSEMNGISDDSATEISAVPNLKMEIPELTEQKDDASSCSFSDSNQEGTSGANLQNSDKDLAPNLTQALSSVVTRSETKREPLDMYNSNSTVPSMLPLAENQAAPNLCHMLAKPGPSGENQLQDTFKNDRGIHGSDSWFMLLSNSDYLSPTERKPDFRERQYTCKICGKTFRNQNSCYNHMAIHKGTSKCTICEYVLSSRGNMKRHMHNVHGVDYSV